METLDLTPKWAALLPAFEYSLANGSDVAKDLSRLELRKMAKAADAGVVVFAGLIEMLPLLNKKAQSSIAALIDKALEETR